MATEKEKVDVGGSEKQEKDAKPNEVEEEDAVEGEVEKVEEQEAEENEMEEEVVKEEDQEDEEEREGKIDEEEAEEEEEEEKGEDEDEDDEGKKTDGEESDKKSEGVKKRSRKRIRELDSPRTPGSERPTRERKTVERFMVGDTPRASASKTLTIEKGQGTQLKDIPNVAFKLSKRKADENLQLLHTILFGKKSKVHTLKKNIGCFSGFVWVENEEKQKAKVKEKIEKCVKEKLLDFCDFLNIPVNKTSTKKEEISTKLLDFLESPHATTDNLLADKEKKGKKRKSKAATSKSPSSSNATAGKSKKKPKLDAESGKKSKPSTEEEEDNKSESLKSEENHDDDSTVREAESDKEVLHSEEGMDSEDDEPEKHVVVEKSSSKRSGKKDTGATELKSKSVGKGSHVKDSKTDKSTKKPSSGTSKKGSEAESKRNRTPSSKKKKDDVESEEEESEVPTKGGSSSKKKSSKSSEKEQGKGKATKAAEKQPSREEMHSVVADMLKEVDFNTATLSDILRQLGKHFEVDLVHRKAEVKEIISAVIESMSDDEGEEEAASGNESEKDGDDE